MLNKQAARAGGSPKRCDTESVAPPFSVVVALKDFHARATWVLEQFADGDIETALLALNDLAWDIWTTVEHQEGASSS